VDVGSSYKPEIDIAMVLKLTDCTSLNEVNVIAI